MSYVIRNLDWGIVTKIPGDVNDYRVLASSRDTAPAVNYYALVRDWLVGELPFQPDVFVPGAPWYLFGIINNPLRQVIIEQKWTDYGDRHNRPVQQITCLLIPFSNLSESACGFLQMAEIFQQQEVKSFLSEVGVGIKSGEINIVGDQLSINLPSREESLRTIANTTSAAEPDLLINLANALLEKPLGLTWTGEPVPSWQKRLEWLDMIMALLPFGVRADCPASMWASSGTPHKMRLYWSERASENHHQVWLREDLTNAAISADCVYIEGLRRKIAKDSISKTIEELTKHVEPVTFETLKNQNVFQFPIRIPVRPPIPEKPDVPDPVQPLIPDPALFQSRVDDQSSVAGMVEAFMRAQSKMELDRVAENFKYLFDNQKLSDFFDKILQRIDDIPVDQQFKKRCDLIYILNKWVFPRMPKNYFQEVAQLTQKFSEEYWMAWIYRVLNHRFYNRTLIRCLSYHSGGTSYLIHLIKFIAGQINYIDLSPDAIDRYLDQKDLRYPIWLIRYAAINFSDVDLILIRLGNFLIKKKQLGYPIPRDAMREMLEDKNVSNQGCSGGLFKPKRKKMLNILRQI
ncbi:MAG TPA: hypothetical protein PLA02_10010 [Brevefilum fermentans]|jgi:hypothetical protein|nr:hypothetical protein [Chloroflexota bacterium]HQA29532.1 hypothetical protein [Brevefilum fermentans]